jgi:RNA polymerase sigma factor (sigma-70 family)
MSPSVSVHFLQTQSDARLLALARRGHERAFEALVNRYRKPLLAYCRRMLLPAARAEDALQQALLQAWLALRDGTEVRDVRAWLFQITHNTALNTLRGSRYDYLELSESLVGAEAPESDLDRRIAVREALAGLAALPELQREALLRTAVEGRSHDEVAAALGLTDGAVRGLIYRARATLRAAATALTPTPLVTWLATAGEHSVPLAQRLSEAAAGGGTAGVIGVLVKGGAAAVTAGALVAGVSAVRPHRLPVSHASTARHGLQRSGSQSDGSPAAVPAADVLSRAAVSGRSGLGSDSAPPALVRAHRNANRHITAPSQSNDKLDHQHEHQSASQPAPADHTGDQGAGPPADHHSSDVHSGGGDPGSSGDHGSSGNGVPTGTTPGDATPPAGDSGSAPAPADHSSPDASAGLRPRTADEFPGAPTGVTVPAPSG